jgi:hypothetical protein
VIVKGFIKAVQNKSAEYKMGGEYSEAQWNGFFASLAQFGVPRVEALRTECLEDGKSTPAIWTPGHVSGTSEPFRNSNTVLADLPLTTVTVADVYAH